MEVLLACLSFRRGEKGKEKKEKTRTKKEKVWKNDGMFSRCSLPEDALETTPAGTPRAFCFGVRGHLPCSLSGLCVGHAKSQILTTGKSRWPVWLGEPKWLMAEQLTRVPWPGARSGSPESARKQCLLSWGLRRWCEFPWILKLLHMVSATDGPCSLELRGKGPGQQLGSWLRRGG